MPHAAVTEGLIWFVILFTPWAFGATEEWSMWVANAAGYSLGLLGLWKAAARWRMPFDPRGMEPKLAHWLTRIVALLTIALLGYVLISLLNARASFDARSHTFHYRASIPWLPHTYDSNYTWPAFWNYLAWACIFWAVWGWLREEAVDGRRSAVVPEDEQPCPDRPTSQGPPSSDHRLPLTGQRRLRRLLWLISINGAVLALQGLLQRATETNKLLWFRATFYNPSAECQFGPFAYRANGAQYLNLIWPVALGLWWSLQRAHRGGRHTVHHVLLPCVILMIAAPIVSLSRGGALITAALCVASGAVLLLDRARARFGLQQGLLGIVLAVGLLGGTLLGGDTLHRRMQQYDDSLLARERLNHFARRMAAEYPVFGTGPETFQPLYQFYKESPEEYWPGQLHNDWLETRITFGWVGFLMILGALIGCGARWFAGGGIRVSWRLVSFIWIAMTGCLVHARWDLPFQVYSIVLLFLVYCAVLLGAGQAGR